MRGLALQNRSEMHHAPHPSALGIFANDRSHVRKARFLQHSSRRWVFDKAIGLEPAKAERSCDADHGVHSFRCITLPPKGTTENIAELGDRLATAKPDNADGLTIDFRAHAKGMAARQGALRNPNLHGFLGRGKGDLTSLLDGLPVIAKQALEIASMCLFEWREQKPCRFNRRARRRDIVNEPS